MRTVVTGANRGIGLELVRQLLAMGDLVEGGVRDPSNAKMLLQLAAGSDGRLRVHPLDVGDGESVRAFARAVGDGPLQLLINNAGTMGKRTEGLGLAAREALGNLGMSNVAGHDQRPGERQAGLDRIPGQVAADLVHRP